MKNFFFYLLTWLLLISTSVSAQDNHWYLFPSGVPEYANRDIYIDQGNTKWIGGYDKGLHKYRDGTWTHYTTSNSPLTDDDVRESCFDTAGNLWITTWNGLNKFDTAGNTWESYNVTGETSDILFSVEVDSKNRIWVGTDGGADPDDGLYMFDGNKWKFYNPTNSPLSKRWISNLSKDRTGKIWGCHGGGLFEINDTTITNHLLEPAGFSWSAAATSVAFDSYNNKWVSVYFGGVGMFDGTNWAIYDTSNSPMPEDKVRSIAVDQNDVVWIGTETKGLVRFDGVNWTIYNTSNSPLKSNRIDAIAVDHLNNVWIAPHYGGIVVHNDQGLSGIYGYVYHDRNNNGKRDSLEMYLSEQVVYIDSGDFASVTDSTGQYHCALLDTGTYVAKVKSTSPYLTGVNPDSIIFSVNNKTLGVNRHFGVRLQSNIHDISVDYTSIDAPRPGFSYSCNLMVSNLGSLTSDSISVHLKYDSNLIFDSSSLQSQLHAGDSLVWKLDSLQLFEKRIIRLYFRLPPDVSLLGKHLFTRIAVNASAADHDSSNNTLHHTELVVGSYDPNDKQVEPAGQGTSGEIPPGTPELTYTIRFQNTGTAPAVNVLIKDTISPYLDISGIRMISASHSYHMSIKNPGVIWWKFSDINLPDSNENEPASHGYIKYKISLRPHLAEGVQIKNVAQIFFDFNPAIITNQTVNSIKSIPVNINKIENDDEELQVYPNPSKNEITVYYKGKSNTSYSLRLYTLNGHLLTTKENISEPEINLDISSYVPGIYFLQLLSSDSIQHKKFIKID